MSVPCKETQILEPSPGPFAVIFQEMNIHQQWTNIQFFSAKLKMMIFPLPLKDEHQLFHHLWFKSIN